MIDRDIQTILDATTADLLFDLSGWAVPQGIGIAGAALVEADVPGLGLRPLAIAGPQGAGKAYYTSFHNESQMTEDMEVLLYDMILAL